MSLFFFIFLVAGSEQNWCPNEIFIDYFDWSLAFLCKCAAPPVAVDPIFLVADGQKFLKHFLWTSIDQWKTCMHIVVAEPWGQIEPMLPQQNYSEWLTDRTVCQEVVSPKNAVICGFSLLCEKEVSSDAGNWMLPCSKNARFPGSIPWAPSPSRSQNISIFRIQGHCIFITHFFLSTTVPGSEVGAGALPLVLAECLIRALTWCLG